MTIPSAFPWPTNGYLIADLVGLYLSPDDDVLDATYGEGVWWSRWRPRTLVIHDRQLDGVDFRHLPHLDASFDVVAFDPPYKLNGRPTPDVDGRYGVDQVATIAQRHDLMLDGLRECARCSRRLVLAKCMTQVASGRKHFQPRMLADFAESECGLVQVDEFLLLGVGRPQPAGRRQVHSHANFSTLLVFRKVRSG